MTPEGFAPGEPPTRREVQRLRERLDRLGAQRLERLAVSLQAPQRQLLTALPLLFHVNHPGLPGFAGSMVPSGIADYQPEREALQAARALARSFDYQRRAHQHLRIQALYAMGSLGSLGQSVGSDIDLWLCHDDELDPAAQRSLRDKIDGIERYGASIGLDLHIFPMSADGFRRGEMSQLSTESSGQMQPRLLLEEFYRTGVRLAGKPALWWLVPPAQEDHYPAYTAWLLDNRFVAAADWLDFGGLDAISPEEFHGGARWLLHKSIDEPYKALLKLMLFESYVGDYPEIRWLSQEVKAMLHRAREPDYERLDPYRLMIERIDDYLGARHQPRRELARRAFYAKTGQALSQPMPRPDWRRRQLEDLIADWGWGQAQLRIMDGRGRWGVEQVMRERNAIVAELSAGYRLLSDFARRHTGTRRLNLRELKLLGRRLYASLERRPGKIDRVNPGLSRDLSAEALWLEQGDDSWRLWTRDPQAGEPAPAAAAKPPELRPVKATGRLLEMLAWLHINGVMAPRTRVHCQRPGLVHGHGEPEYRRVLRVLQQQLDPVLQAPTRIAAFAAAPRLRCSLVFINAGLRDPAEGDAVDLRGLQERPDPLSFGNRRQFLIAGLDHLYATSWGEVLVEGDDDGVAALLTSLCRHLELSRGEPTPWQVYCFHSPRADALAARVRSLGEAVQAGFAAMGEAGRYLLRLGREFYLIEREGEAYAWERVGDEAACIGRLGAPAKRFMPYRVDPQLWPQSPLSLLYERNLPGVIQVFYRPDARGVSFWVLDERGGLFQQHMPEVSEAHFLAQQRRFFDSVQTYQLMLASAEWTDGLAEAVSLYRLHRRQEGWSLAEAHAEPIAAEPFLELLLVPGPGGPAQSDFALRSGDREFGHAALGERLYAEVAGYVLAARHTGERYPLYITGVLPGGLESGCNWAVADMLRLKRQVEQRLNTALRDLPVPASPPPTPSET